VAYRKASFAHGLVFSERSLKPGEVFLVEITQTEVYKTADFVNKNSVFNTLLQLGWNGHLRLGLTQLDPNTFFDLPLISFDLLPLGQTWVFSLFKEGSAASTDHTSIRDGSLVRLKYEMFLIIVRMIHSDLINFGFSQVLKMMMASSGARWWRKSVYNEFFFCKFAFNREWC
jgi:neuralized-like protein 2